MISYQVTNPATGEVESTYATASDAEIHQALEGAHAAWKSWRTVAPEERAALLTRVADLHHQRREELADIIVREMGKPKAQALGELSVVVDIYRYYADNGPAWLAPEAITTAGATAQVRKQGLGVLLGIMPWNFPYYQVARFAAPNLLNGNTILLKHAPQCPESAQAIEQIFRDAGAAQGLYTNIFASNEQVSELIEDPRVLGVSLTGSERAGAAVAEQAGRHLKKVVLELGGSDPFLVLADADLEQAVTHAIQGRFGNCGQACNAAKRIIVEDAVYDAFLAAFEQGIQSIKVGNPMADDTVMGPMSSEQALRNLDGQVQDAISQGARLVTGGKRLDQPGAWYAPTLLVDVTPDMRIFHEELFGPVAVVYRASDLEEAIALANDSQYGLGAVIQTTDPVRAQALADRLEVGMVHINEPPGSEAELPFGGVKRSGFGRELGRAGMDEFVNRQMVKVARPG
ncbi:succinate-semialdehyde dehydrogenase [Halomonas cupida]|uniref:Succinate-semialdehyde dehydrogenase n=1 Tax=Halomonas cupida TaxID=44933 RepID=A0A1M6ZSF0_9GAMM|nr:NAD-dependent succinate-semialdehyde dehydrogenase [Halomonas cupida]GEN22663.1 succinate-semialdehyde dehydrogenase [Halomonas cupida]SHL33370.1 succinate-semialdehyde dehydrogenase / glutarate-semialdehyde dehydrogenase [Halomonas cupida]